MPTAADITRRDLSRWDAPAARASPIGRAVERAAARTAGYRPMTVEDRFAAFEKIGYRPLGLYLPDEERLLAEVRRRLRAAGDLPTPDRRLSEYWVLQAETAELEREGHSGHWTGQYGWSRSRKRFRQVAASRRAGKTTHASAESVATMVYRPRMTVWIVSETMDSVDRCFQMVLQRFADLGTKLATKRDQEHEKLIVLENGSRCVGVSLHEGTINVGDKVDLAVVDEGVYVSRDDIEKVILPPLTDREGNLLLISSEDGVETDFYEMLQEDDEDWDRFDEVTWDINFAMFPQGRATPAIQANERLLVRDPEAFLEQYGGVARETRRRIYPQYIDAVHLGDYPYKKGIPVILGVDPSSGANEYAVGAFQMYDGDLYMIDEYYEAGALAEDAIVDLRRRPWIDEVREGVCDSAQPDEVRRWRDGGFDIIAVEKPKLEDSIPVVRKLFRDPFLFYPILQRVIADVMEERGDDRPVEGLSFVEQRLLKLEAHGRLTAARLTPSYIKALRSCARIFVNRDTCPNFAKEVRTYAYRKPAKGARTVQERPRKWADHLMDLFRYVVWTYMRFGFDPRTERLEQSYMRLAGFLYDEDDEDEGVVRRAAVTPSARLARAVESAKEAGYVGVPVDFVGPTWLEVMRGMNQATPEVTTTLRPSDNRPLGVPGMLRGGR